MTPFGRRGSSLAFFAWTAVFWSPASLAASTGPPSFDVWTIEDGLPQSSVNDIVQTPDGYLWLATYGGDSEPAQRFEQAARQTVARLFPEAVPA